MPQAANAIVTVGLAALVCLQVWTLSLWHYAGSTGRTDPDTLAYLLAAFSFLPLLVRRRWPAPALAVTGACAVAYLSMHYPPAFVIAGPMIAIYSLVVYGRRWIPALVALAAPVLVVATFATAVPGISWVSEASEAFSLLAAAAFMGAVQRSRRAQARAAEERALEAERTREEEARRRVEQERLRIAAEVHDVVAHSLSAVIVQADAGLQALGAEQAGSSTDQKAGRQADPQAARQALRTIARSGRDALAELRSTVRFLRTNSADATLHEPAHGIGDIPRLLDPARESGLRVDLDLPSEDGHVPAIVALSAYRIVQESVTNVLRHAHAGQLTVRLTTTHDDLGIVVRDDGQARRADAGEGGGGRAAPSTDRPVAAGHGIAGMAGRVAALGGSFAAGPLPEGGFEVRATLPLGAYR